MNLPKKNVFCVVVSCIMTGTMASGDVNIFFPQINGNLSRVTWAHAVNNSTYLQNTLDNSEIMMIEADVALGIVNGTTETVPIMAHPPENVSDISLATFLQTIDQFNERNINSTTATRKGVKLDFKSIEAFSESVSIVSTYDRDSYPIWLNADILPGPINSTTTPVNAAQFLTEAQRFNNSALSIGWTTNYGPNVTGSYTDEQINAMQNVTSQYNVTRNVTFPVRAGMAAESLPQISRLLGGIPESTLTLWSSEGDAVNVTKLRELIASIGLNKVFIDVPTSLSGLLHLDDLPNSNVMPSNNNTVPDNSLLAGNGTALGNNTMPGNNTVLGNNTMPGNNTMLGNNTVSSNHTSLGTQPVASSSSWVVPSGTSMISAMVMCLSSLYIWW